MPTILCVSVLLIQAASQLTFLGQVYTVVIEWVPPSVRPDGQPNGAYEMDFGLFPSTADQVNPHQDVASFLSSTLRSQATRSMTRAVEGLIWVRRDSIRLFSNFTYV